MLALSDFSEPLADGRTDVADAAGPTGCAPVAGPPAGGLYFGGSPAAQSCFSFWYGWDFPLGGVARMLASADCWHCA